MLADKTLENDFEIATIAKMIAANRAIVEPLPEPISDEINNPPNTDVSPKT